MAKYRGKTHGRPVATKHCKFLSSHPRVPDDGRDRAVDGGRQEVEPLRPSGRNHDPDRLPTRLAGIRVVRSAMAAGRDGHRAASCPQGEERLAECPTGAVLACLYNRAGRADDAQGLPCAIRSDRGSGQDAIPDTSAHAAAWLRLCPSQCRPRHTGATGLARPQKHPAHGALHRAGPRQVQRLLAIGAQRLTAPNSRRADGHGERRTGRRVVADAVPEMDQPRPRPFRTFQVCPKDLRAAERQAGDARTMALGINGATSESARLTELP
jgi:hypothetical protein